MPTLAPTVYLLCLASSTACAWLLARRYARTKARLLLWSALCFVLLSINNLLVVIDLLVIEWIDFSVARLAALFTAVLVLLYGFIWELD